MFQNLFDSTLCTQSLIFFLSQKLINQILGLWTHINIMLNWIRKSDVCLLDQKEHLMLVFMEKWWDTNEHFIKQNTQGPNIDCEIMPLTF